MVATDFVASDWSSFNSRCDWWTAPVTPGATVGHCRYSGIVVKVAAGTVQQELCENGVVAANLLYVDGDFAVAARDKSAGSLALLVSDVPTH